MSDPDWSREGILRRKVARAVQDEIEFAPGHGMYPSDRMFIYGQFVLCGAKGMCCLVDAETVARALERLASEVRRDGLEGAR